MLAVAFISDDIVQKHGLSTAIIVAILTWFFVGFVPWIMRRYEARLDAQEKRHVEREKTQAALYERTMAQVLEQSRSVNAGQDRRLGAIETGLRDVAEEIRQMRLARGDTGRVRRVTDEVPTIAPGTQLPPPPGEGIDGAPPSKAAQTISYGDAPPAAPEKR